MKKIYKFHWDCGRSGDIRSIFVAEEDEVKAYIGREVYFGEVLGKHSEISGTLEEDDLTVVSENPEFVKIFEDHNMGTGLNPVSWVKDYDEDCANSDIEEEGDE